MEFVNRPDPRLISCRKRFVKDRANGDKRSLRDSTAIRGETGQRQQKLRDRVKVISREAKRETLRGEKTGDRSGREEEGERRREKRRRWGNTHRDPIEGIFSSGSGGRPNSDLSRIYARSVDERVKDWRGEYRARTGGEKGGPRSRRKGEEKTRRSDAERGETHRGVERRSAGKEEKK